MPRTRVAAMTLSWLLLLGGCPSTGFSCTDHAQCQGTDVQGSCEANGYCSFPDEMCASKRRFGDYAGSSSNRCVPSDAAANETGSTSGDAASAEGSTTAVGSSEDGGGTGEATGEATGDPGTDETADSGGSVTSSSADTTTTTSTGATTASGSSTSTSTGSGTSTGSDASTSELGGDLNSCQEQYGSVPGFTLCDETPEDCTFYAMTGGRSCAALCTSFGGSCLASFDDMGGTCNPNTQIFTCASVSDDLICICTLN